jgi:hypothetical protein
MVQIAMNARTKMKGSGKSDGSRMLDPRLNAHLQRLAGEKTEKTFLPPGVNTTL